MSDEKRISEREAILRERAAFREGTKYFMSSADSMSAELYPLPKVERPRVVQDGGGFEWRIVDDRFEWRHGYDGPWLNGRSFELTPSRITALAELLAHPTELVEDGE